MALPTVAEMLAQFKKSGPLTAQQAVGLPALTSKPTSMGVQAKYIEPEEKKPTLPSSYVKTSTPAYTYDKGLFGQLSKNTNNTNKYTFSVNSPDDYKNDIDTRTKGSTPQTSWSNISVAPKTTTPTPTPTPIPTPTPTSVPQPAGAMTKEQQDAYFASQRNATNPLSPAEWLRQQQGRTPTGGVGYTPEKTSQPLGNINPNYQPPSYTGPTHEERVAQAEADRKKQAEDAKKSYSTYPQYNAQAGLGGLIGQLIGAGQQTSGEVEALQSKIAEIDAQLGREVENITNEPIDLDFQTGRIGNAQIRAAVEKEALGQQLTAKEQRLSNIANIYAQAIGASMPQTIGFGQLTFDPVTGQRIRIGSGATGAGAGIPGFDPMDPEASVPYVAQLVASGQMRPSEAEALLGGNPAFSRSLDLAIRQINPNYDRSVSEAQADVRASVPEMRSAQEAATKTIPMVEQAYNAMPRLARTNWAGVNQLTQSLIDQWAPDALGRQAIIEYATLVDNSRSEIANLIGTALGITPTEAGNIANGWIRAGATPEEIKQAYANAQKMIEDRISARETSGQTGPIGTYEYGGGGNVDYSQSGFWGI